MTDHEKLVRAGQESTGYEHSDIDGLLRHMQRQVYACIFGMPEGEATRLRTEFQRLRDMESN